MMLFDAFYYLIIKLSLIIIIEKKDFRFKMNEIKDN